MALVYLTIKLLVILIFTRCTFCATGDPVMFLPPFEVRTVKSDSKPVMFPMSTTQFHPTNQQQMAASQLQQVFHTMQPSNSAMQPSNSAMQPPNSAVQPTSVIPPQPPPPSVPSANDKQLLTTEKPHDAKNTNFTFDEFVEALHELTVHKEEERQDQSRAAARDYEYSAYPSYSHPSPYGYPLRPPSYGSYAPSAYHESASAMVPATTIHNSSPTKLSLLKPELNNVIKPVATKTASKMGGLIGLVLAFLTGTAPDDPGFKGFKDIIINGIVKPFLVAKIGIKSLISKLTIPMISLFLINLELLVTVWWLWEECPQPVPAPPPFSYPKQSYNYNTYR